MRISECPVPPCIVSIWRTSVQPSDGRSTMNAVLAACGQVRVVLGAGDEDGEVGPVGVGDEPLVPVEHPLLAVLVALGLDQRRIRPGHLGLGHGEARPARAGAQRAEVLLLLLVRAPVQQRVHVALVGRLAVEDPRAVRRLGRLGLDHRQLDVPEAHAAPLLRHVGQPDAGLLGLLAHVHEGTDVRLAVVLLEVLVVDLLLRRLDHVVDERAHPGADLLELGREAEVDGHQRGLLVSRGRQSVIARSRSAPASRRTPSGPPWRPPT